MKYLEPLIHEFKAAENPEKARAMSDYMRGKFEFYGLPASERRAIQKSFLKKYDYPQHSDLFDVLFYLWSLPQRECQHFALDLLRKHSKHYLIEDVDKLEKLILKKSWWDTVDDLAAWSCGDYFKLYPQNIVSVTDKWMESDNMWLMRSVLLFQLKYKEDTNTELLSKWIQKLSTHNDFFIRKAIGWILREYSKANSDWVRNFLDNNDLSGLSVREASKYL